MQWKNACIARIKFQFHTGSIKSFITDALPLGSETFQFHTGSIKSEKTEFANGDAVIGFNSILVRLKESLQ